MPQSNDTQLEITPQPTKMMVGDTQKLTINTDADSFTFDIDNSNATYNSTTSILTADTEGQSHIIVKATAQGKNETRVEWDLLIEAKAVAPQPPVPPVNPLPLPIKLAVGEQFIDNYFRVVKVEADLGVRAFVDGKYRNVFECIVVDKDLSKRIYNFTEDGKCVQKQYTYSDYSFNSLIEIIEWDNKYFNVYDSYISVLKRAIVNEQNPNDDYIYFFRDNIQMMEIDKVNNIITLNKDTQVILQNEIKIKQIEYFLGLNGVY